MAGKSVNSCLFYSMLNHVLESSRQFVPPFKMRKWNIIASYNLRRITVSWGISLFVSHVVSSEHIIVNKQVYPTK